MEIIVKNSYDNSLKKYIDESFEGFISAPSKKFKNQTKKSKKLQKLLTLFFFPLQVGFWISPARYAVISHRGSTTIFSLATVAPASSNDPSEGTDNMSARRKRREPVSLTRPTGTNAGPVGYKNAKKREWIKMVSERQSHKKATYFHIRFYSHFKLNKNIRNRHIII